MGVTLATQAISPVEEALRALDRREPPEAPLAVARNALAGSDLSDLERARALLVIGIAEHRLDRWQLALRALFDALEVLGRVRELSLRVEVLRTIGIVYAWRGRHSEAALHVTLALADAAILGDQGLLADLLGELARVHLEMRRWAHAQQLLRRQQQLAVDLLSEYECIRLQLAMAQAQIGLGDYQEAARLSEDTFQRAHGSGHTYATCIALRDLALARLRSGHLPAARDTLQRARSFAGPDPGSYEHLSLRAVEAELAIAVDGPEAEAAIAEVVEALSTRQLTGPEIDARLLESEILWRRGRHADAARTLRVALARARHHGLALLETTVREEMTRLSVGPGLIPESGRQISEDFRRTSDGYVLLQKLGSGAFGSVFRAYDLERGMEVALKRMTVCDDYDSLRRAGLLATARTELEAAARIVHPGVARVMAVGELPDGGVYVVQEYVPGPSLRSLLVRGQPAVDPAQAVLMLRRLALALEALHLAGVVHGDVKPDNVLCPSPDRPVLVDLGIAFLAGSAAAPISRGTLPYAAPEQQRLERWSPRVDLFALGVVAFEWLTGELPDQIVRPRAAFWSRSAGPSAELARTVRDPGLASLVLSMIDADPARRPESAGQVVAAMTKILETV